MYSIEHLQGNVTRIQSLEVPVTATLYVTIYYTVYKRTKRVSWWGEQNLVRGAVIALLLAPGLGIPLLLSPGLGVALLCLGVALLFSQVWA